MMKTHRLLLLVPMLLSGLLVLTDASAQSGSMGGGPGLPDPNSSEQIEYRLSRLQGNLKLTAEQGAAWKVYSDTTLAYASYFAAEQGRASGTLPSNNSALNNPPNTGQVITRVRNRSDALDAIKTAGRNLYQVLTPEQKTVADMQMPTIIRLPALGSTGNSADNGLPDLGSSVRPLRPTPPSHSPAATKTAPEYFGGG